MPDTLTQDQWLKRVLGVSVPGSDAPSPKAKQVRFAPVPQQIARPSGGVQITQTRPRSGGRIQPPPVLRPDEFDLGGKKKIAVARTPGGGTVYTAPPPVREITFSGGGAKGAALPGAIKALQESGVLRDAKKIVGASVGSMTAALIAAGITAEEFTRVANDDSTTDAITEGSGGSTLGLLGAALKNKFTGGTLIPLTGLETVVGKVLDATLRRCWCFGRRHSVRRCAQAEEPDDGEALSKCSGSLAVRLREHCPCRCWRCS